MRDHSWHVFTLIDSINQGGGVVEFSSLYLAFDCSTRMHGSYIHLAFAKPLDSPILCHEPHAKYLN